MKTFNLNPFCLIYFFLNTLTVCLGATSVEERPVEIGVPFGRSG